MNGPPRGPTQDNSRLYQPMDGPFNGSDSALMGDKLKEFQNREQIFGRDHAMQHFYYTNADQVMHLASPNYKKAKGPYEIKFNKELPSVLKTKHVPNTRNDRSVDTKETLKKGGKYTKNVYRKAGKKEILGKERVIYKADGSNKEYVKSKDTYVPVTEYKKLNRK